MEEALEFKYVSEAMKATAATLSFINKHSKEQGESKVCFSFMLGMAKMGSLINIPNN